MKLKYPTVNELTLFLRDVVRDLQKYKNTNETDVRLQVTGDEWFAHWGDPCYDTDHSGIWGASMVTRDMTAAECMDIAHDLISQCQEQEQES